MKLLWVKITLWPLVYPQLEAYTQLMCAAFLSAGAQTSGHEEREHSDQEAQTKDAQE